MPQFCPSQRSFVSAIHAPGSLLNSHEIRVFCIKISKLLITPTTPITLTHKSKEVTLPSFRLRDLAVLFTVDVVKSKKPNSFFLGSFLKSFCKSALGENIVVIFCSFSKYGGIVFQ